MSNLGELLEKDARGEYDIDTDFAEEARSLGIDYGNSEFEKNYGGRHV